MEALTKARTNSHHSLREWEAGEGAGGYKKISHTLAVVFDEVVQKRVHS